MRIAIRPSIWIRLSALGVALLGMPARASFTDAAADWGLAVGDRMSWGATFVDLDYDGDVDLYIGNHWRNLPDLLRNDGPSSFVAIGGHYAGLAPDRHDQLWADLDGDGAPDQYSCKGGAGTQPNELFWNEPDGTFLEGAEAANADDELVPGFFGRGREMAMGDFDGDGALDIYLADAFTSGYPPPSVFLRNAGDRWFQRLQAPILQGGWPRCSAADYNGDRRADVVLVNPFDDNGHLMRSNGNWTFTDVTSTAFPGITQPLRCAQALSWGDYDNDGDLDLFAGGGDGVLWDHAALEADSLRFFVICSPGQTPTVKLVTDADSVFMYTRSIDYSYPVCYAGPTGTPHATWPFTAAIASIRGDPPPQLDDGLRAVMLWSRPAAGADTVHVAVTTNSSGYNLGGHVRVVGGSILGFSVEGFDAPPPQATGDLTDRLFRNEGNGTFAEVTAAAFPSSPPGISTAASAWGDYDNDGYLDLFVANSGTVVTLNQPDRLWHNQGNGTFVDVAAAEGVTGALTGMTSGGCWGDVDGDGFLDLFVNEGLEAPPLGIGPRELYINTPNGNHWVEVRLRGTGRNGSGVGAMLRLVGATGVRRAAVLGDGDNAFSSAFGAHVGLGIDTVVDSLEIAWPSGTVDRHFAVPADTRWVAVEGEASLRPFGVPPTLVAGPDSVGLVTVGSDSATSAFSLANPGAVPITATLTTEDCTGQPAPWLGVSPALVRVWPGDPPAAPSVVARGSGLPTGLYCGRVIVESNSANGPDTLAVSLEVLDHAVGVEASLGAPAVFGLSPPRPNPARAGVRFRLGLPAAAAPTVVIHDVVGRVVRRLATGAVVPAGWHELVWDGRDDFDRRAAAGIYWVRASAGDDVDVRRVVLIQ